MLFRLGIYNFLGILSDAHLFAIHIQAVAVELYLRGIACE
jgi:hypothetical protein